MTDKTLTIIARVLSGEYSDEDITALEKWLAESDGNLKDFSTLERLWVASEITANKKNYNYSEAFEKFLNQTRKPALKGLTAMTLLRKSFKWAAIGLIIAALGSLTTYMVVTSAGNKNHEVYEVKSAAGSRSTVTLSDGSTVWLNAGSRLTYSGNFGKGSREVRLEGEGYFNVAANNSDPFRVITSKLEITALGTSFNVKSYPGENYIQTTLVSGKVKIQRSEYGEAERGVFLEPNQQITYYLDTEQLLVTSGTGSQAEEREVVSPEASPEKSGLERIVLTKGVDPEIFTSWKDNRLIFDDEPFESIAVKLERRYGANIIIKDEEIKCKRFKGRFDEITIEQALSALSFASPFRYEIKQDTIFISGPDKNLRP